MNISCVIPTKHIENIASRLGKTVNFTRTLVSAWQSLNPGLDPEYEDIKEYYDSRVPSHKDLTRISQNNNYAKLNRDYSPTLRHDRASNIARMFSDIVNREVENKLDELDKSLSETDDPEELARLLEKKREYNSYKGRHAVIKDITLTNIIQEIRNSYEEVLNTPKEELTKTYGEDKVDYIINEYQKILDNFPALFDEACPIVEASESLRIVTEYHTFNNGKEESIALSGEVYEDSQEDTSDNEASSDVEGDERATGNEGWNYKVRFTDPYSTLSKDVKKVLSSIVKVDSKGRIDVDDLGNTRYLNPEYTHVVLLNELSGMIDADDFMVKVDGRMTFPALDKASAKYPWIKQVINALVIDENLRGSFFADLRKDFIPYWKQLIDKDGKQITKSLNTITAAESMFNTIESNYVERNILDDDSIYTKAGKISSDKAAKGEKLCDETMIRIKDFGPKDFDVIVNNVAKMLNMAGIEANESYIKDLLKSQSGISDLKSILYELKNIFTDSQKVDTDTDLIEQFKDSYKNISDKIGTIDEFESIASFRDGDESRYSYSTPNYIDTTIKKLKSDDRRVEFLNEEFGAYTWFKNPKNGKWRSEWLRLIAGEDDDIKEISDDIRQHLSTKEVISIGDKPYTDWRPKDIKKAFINEYYSIPKNKGSKVQYAWYNMPIFSDSPVVKFIRFVKYTTDSEGTFKQKLLPKLRNVVKQELYRIRLVNDRRKAGAEPIQNFDKNGDRFHFFPELNNGDFLDRAIKLSDDKNVTELNALIDTAMNEVMNNLFASFMLNSDMNADDIAKMLFDNNVIKSKNDVGDALEEYFWNQVFASTQIIELTTTDLAFYKDAVDFQKRYKEVYASGTKLNTNTRYGKKFRNTLYIADDIITSPVYNDIKGTLNKAVKKGLIKSYDRDNILNKFKDVNVGDAQAYVSPEAMRSILDMAGKWTEEMQAAYDRFEAGEFNIADFNVVWQTLKPFVFTQLRKPDGLGRIIKVPHQNKNSEYLLLAAYGMIANSLNKSPQLKALQKYMTDNKIDVIQFQSAVKAGGQGIIDVNYSESGLEKALKPEILKAAEAELGNEFTTASDIDKFKAGANRMLESGRITQDSYNSLMESVLPTEDDVYNTLDKYAKENGEFKPEYLHTISYNDYMIQQPVPEHLVDTEAIFGSQLRNLIIADLPEDFNTVVNGKKLNKRELIDLYDSLIVENLLENFSRIRGQVENIYTLQEVLLNQVKGNVKYSRDMINALQIIDVVNPITGETEKAFNIPLSNPIITLEFQKLVTSLFKNGVTVQHIKGGNAVQVSDYGLTDELKIRRDKNGKLLGFECYLPATSIQFFRFFMTEDKNGNQILDIKKLKKAGLDKIIGYRIPTEDKYSMAPLIIKGFLPQQNGSTIMLPSEITTIAGSDFDIDKMFLMLPEFRIVNYDYNRALKDYKNIMSDEATKKLLSVIFQGNAELEAAMEEAPNDFKEWWKDNKENYKLDEPYIEKVKYNTNKNPRDNNRMQRNNMLIDIIFNVLTNESVEDKLFNPGGYDGVKVQARISNIINNESIYKYFLEKYGFDNRKDAIDYLLKLSKEGNLKELNSFIDEYNKLYNTERNSLTPDTFIYNHTQNMTGGALVGMYANNNSAQAKYQHSNLSLKSAYSFMLNGRRIKSLHDVTSELGERISRNCSQMLAASVDNVKDPVLADLMQNQNTAKIMGFMLRAGMSLEEASLMFSQPIVKGIFDQFGSISIKPLKKAIESATKFLANNGGTAYLTNIPDFDSKLLMNNILVSYDVDNLTDNEKNMALAYQIKAAELMLNIVNCANKLSMITQISRADSPNGGILNTIGGAKVQVAKVDDLHVRASEKTYPFEGIEDVIDNNKVTLKMSNDELRDKLLNTKMSKLQAFYSLGIELGSKVFNRFFPQVNRYSDAILSQFVEDTFGAYLNNTNIAVEHFNLIYKDLVNFALSGTKMFGDDGQMTYAEKRDYYVNKFPDKFMEIKRNNPDIAKLGIMKKLNVFNGEIVFEKSGRLRPQTKDSFMRDMDTLLYMSDTSRALAEDLIKYAYYTNGLWFSPNGFSNFFSTDFLNSFPEIVDTMRNLGTTMSDPKYSRFLSQFYANHDKIAEAFVEVQSPQFNDEKQAVVPINKVLNYLGNPVRFIKINKTKYELVNFDDDFAQYAPAPKFTDLRYNMNMDAFEMEGFNEKVKREKIDFNSFPEDIEGLVSDNFEGAVGMLESGFEGVEEMVNPIEKYPEDEGENTLNEPLCKN